MEIADWKHKEYYVWIPSIAYGHGAVDGHARGTIKNGIIALDYSPVGDGQVTFMERIQNTNLGPNGWPARIRYSGYSCEIKDIATAFMDGF